MPLVFGDLTTCAWGNALTLTEGLSDLFLLQDLFLRSMPGATVLLAGIVGSWGRDPELNKQCQSQSLLARCPRLPARSL